MDASIIVSRVGASIMVNRVVASSCRRVGASMVVDRVGAFDHCRQGGGWVLRSSLSVGWRVGASSHADCLVRLPGCF